MSGASSAADDQLVLPDWNGGCISNVMPALLAPAASAPAWLPAGVHDARQVVLLVLDGLGWRQMQARAPLTRTLRAMTGGAITTVAPSTTATALCSLTTGTPPGEHGVIGYRMWVEGSVLNVLRWTTPEGDARQRVPPRDVQVVPPFCGQRPTVISRAEFLSTGFTMAHLETSAYRSYRTASTLVTEISLALRAGSRFVYAYYDGLDKVSHEYGLGEHFDAEMGACDRIVESILNVLPKGATLLVTADHGQVHTADNVVDLAPDVLALVASQSGEGRFRWLHARPGQIDSLHEVASTHHRDQAWVMTRQQMIEDGWFGPRVSADAMARLGDVGLVAKGTCAFADDADTGPYHLIGRHGSLTAEEMLVPLLAAGND